VSHRAAGPNVVGTWLGGFLEKNPFPDGFEDFRSFSDGKASETDLPTFFGENPEMRIQLFHFLKRDSHYMYEKRRA